MKATVTVIIVLTVFCAGVAYKFMGDEKDRVVHRTNEANQMVIPKPPASDPTKSK